MIPVMIIDGWVDKGSPLHDEARTFIKRAGYDPDRAQSTQNMTDGKTYFWTDEKPKHRNWQYRLIGGNNALILPKEA